MIQPGFRKYPSRSDVFIICASIPLYAAGVSKFGFRLSVALAISLAVGSLTELIAARIRGREPGHLAIPCWFLLPLVLPPVFPLWMVAIAAFFACLIGVVFFGGHGRQIASPVAIGWAFAALSFPAKFGFGWSLPFRGFSMGFTKYTASVLTIDHPLVFLNARSPVALGDILWGAFPQPPGSALPPLVLLCGLLLLVFRVADFRSAISFLGSTVVLVLVFNHLAPQSFPPATSLFVGNLAIVGFFIYPNPRNAPRTRPGRWLTGLVAGAAAFLIRSFSSFPDGVLFAVLLGNVFSPLIDEGVLNLKYGKRR